jgi:hypothetical protein
MATAKNKTTANTNSVTAFIKAIKDEQKRKDFATLIELVTKNTKLEPSMWGTAIVGFGTYHYKYDSGREGDAPLFGMAARASSITLYIGSEFEKKEALVAQLGKHKISGGCFHIQKLLDIDTSILMQIIKNSIAHRKKTHAC